MEVPLMRNTVARNNDGRLEVFAVDPSGLSHADEVAPSAATWSPFSSLQGGASSNGVAVAMNRDGRLEVFIINDSGDCWHSWQTTAGGAWSPWGQMGSGLTGTPAAAQNQDGRL